MKIERSWLGGVFLSVRRRGDKFFPGTLFQDRLRRNYIAQTQKVRGQILKIEIAPKILRIYSDKFVNRICLIANTFQFEIMYICGT